jgi:hypothetical protein
LLGERPNGRPSATARHDLRVEGASIHRRERLTDGRIRVLVSGPGVLSLNGGGFDRYGLVSGNLIALTGLIYLYVALDQFRKGNSAMGMTYAGYAFSNVGLYFLAR